MISKRHASVGIVLFLLSWTSMGCSGADEATTAPVESADEALSKPSCARQKAIQEKWEGLLIESTAQEITREELPPAAMTFLDHVQGSDQVAYKAKVGSTTTYAVTYWPNNSDTVLGEVVVFYPSGSRAANGWWGDSPQIYWRGQCRA